MSNLVMSPDDFGLKIYNRFPPRYREDDIDQKYALKRYLEAVSEGGFRYTIEELNGILDFTDPDSVRAEILPVLFKQYGLEVFNGIPEQYLRYFLPRLSEAWSKKGSMDVIEFVTSTVVGVKSTVTSTYDPDTHNVNVDIRLEMDINLGGQFPDAQQFDRLLDEFLPFYLGKTIIYVFTFDDEGFFHIPETLHDDIKANYEEHGYILHTHYGIKGMLNYPYYLNEDFVLNDARNNSIDPDAFIDTIKYMWVEDLHLPVEEHIEVTRIIETPVLETIRFSLDDDLVYEGSTFPYKDVLSLSYTDDDEELGLETTTYINSPAIKEGCALTDNLTCGLFTNVTQSTINQNRLTVPTAYDVIRRHDGFTKVIYAIPV